jgi:hypothetical protein
MSTEISPLRLTDADLNSPQVEQYLEEREMLRRAVPEVPSRPWIVRMFYSTWFYLSLAGGLGALVAWAVLEPFFVEGNERQAGDGIEVVNILMFPTIVGCIGLFLGAAEGIMCRNPRRALISAVVGTGIGFVGGLLSILVGGCIMFISGSLAFRFWKNPQPDAMPDGLAFAILMMGRGAAWAVASIPAGIGQGIALREKKVIVNGLLGGVLGGLLGGLLFDPISLVFQAGGRATVSRAVGFTTIGLLVGMFVGLVELWTRTAWLLMRAGPLAGKQFVLYRNPTVLGSSPKADIYLFKDGAIEPRHALIHALGGRFLIEDCETPDGTYVNGLPAKKQPLNHGDQIVLGETVLEFALRDAK